MRFYMNKEFWNEANILAKGCLFLSGFFADLAMKLMGYQNKKL